MHERPTPRTPSTPARAARLLSASAIAALGLAACSVGGGAPSPAPEEPTASAASPTASAAIGGKGEAGTPAACAVAASPWVLDTVALAESIRGHLESQGATVDSVNVTGTYTVDFSRNGAYTAQTRGIASTTQFQLSDGVAVYMESYDEGTAVANWAEEDESGEVITFSGWSSDIDWTGDAWDRDISSATDGFYQFPLWEPSYSTFPFKLQCTSEELVMSLKSSPDAILMVFHPAD